MWSNIVLVLAVLPWLSYAIVLMFFSLSILYCRLKLHRVSDPLQKMDHLPGVSVVKPLMGVDPFLETNLESHFALNYPKFELLLCVEDEQDPAISVSASTRALPYRRLPTLCWRQTGRHQPYGVQHGARVRRSQL